MHARLTLTIILLALTSLRTQAAESWYMGELLQITPENADQVRELIMLSTDGAALYDSAFSPDGQTIAYGGADRLVVWDLEAQTTQQSFQLNDVTLIQFSSDSTMLAVRSSAGLTVYNEYLEPDLFFEALYLNGAINRLTDVEFDLENDLLIGVGPGSGEIYRWELSSGAILFLIDFQRSELQYVRFSVLNADGALNYILSYPANLEIRETQHGLVIAQVDFGGQFTSEYSRMISSFLDISDDDQVLLFKLIIREPVSRSILIWSDADGQVLTTQDIPYISVFPGALSPDNRVLALGKWEEGDEIYLWDSEQGEELAVLASGHTERLTSLSFNADGTLLMSTSGDGTLRLWGIPAGE